MKRAIKTDQIFTDMLKCDPKLLEEIKLKQKISLFENLSIEDNQPVILTFNTSVGASVDPLITTISTQVQVDYPATNQVVINKCVGESYKEYKSFWQKLKLLFSKKSIYTKENKER